MSDLKKALQQIIEDSTSLDVSQLEKQLSGLLAISTLNPTGDDPEVENIESVIDVLAKESPLSPHMQDALKNFKSRHQILSHACVQVSTGIKAEMEAEIHHLATSGFLHEALIEKFKIQKNREFLDKGLYNAACPWQMAMVANWALSEEGLKRFSGSTWGKHYPEMDLQNLIEELTRIISFRHIPTLRTYRKEAMHHYPKVSEEEFRNLSTDAWQEVIDAPSGRPAIQDVPGISPFVKQGDIEHSLYRHYLMPDLLNFMRNATPVTSKPFDLTGADKNVLLSLPIVIQQIENELFTHVKTAIADQIQQWATSLQSLSNNDVHAALAIAQKIWNYRRTPAASECHNPVDNLIKGFTATIQNAFSHFSDINFSASHGDNLDPRDVSEKFVLFASVSNGQLDNLAIAHQRYIADLPNPAQWDNENFFQHFLAVNRETDLKHIQAHFLIDKTRGCPAVPQIARFHAIVLDLILDFVLNEFGEENLRNAGNWFLQEKTPAAFN